MPQALAAADLVGRLGERDPELLPAAHRAAVDRHHAGALRDGHQPKYSLSVATASWPASRSSVSVQAIRRPISIDWSMLL